MMDDRLKNKIYSEPNITVPQNNYYNEEYLEIKKEYKEQIEKLETQLNDKPRENKVDIPQLFEKALETLTNIWKVYTEGDIAVKRQIIGSIFPEKLEFYENHYRTTRINAVAHYIFQINNGLSQNKNRRNDNNNHFPCWRERLARAHK